MLQIKVFKHFTVRDRSLCLKTYRRVRERERERGGEDWLRALSKRNVFPAPSGMFKSQLDVPIPARIPVIPVYWSFNIPQLTIVRLTPACQANSFLRVAPHFALNLKSGAFAKQILSGKSSRASGSSTSTFNRWSLTSHPSQNGVSLLRSHNSKSV